MATQQMDIFLNEEQARLLRHISTEQGRSSSDIIREALDEYFIRRSIGPYANVQEPRRAIPDEEWRTQFEAIRARLSQPVNSAEVDNDIEAEIGIAHAEVRAAHTDRRSKLDA